MIKINTSGDYVQLIYVDPVTESVQQELRSDTDAFECSYDSDGKLFMQFGAMRFENPDPTDFTINGVAVTDAADFISKLSALFTGGSGGNTIYTGDGSLSGDRIISTNDHSLSIGESDYPVPALSIDLSVTDQMRVTLEAFNETGDGNYAYASGQATNTYGDIQIAAAFNDGASQANIHGNAQSGSATLVYTADTHTFNGVINLPTQAAPGSPNDGDVWREDNTNTGLKIRINGVTKTITVS